MKGLDNQRILWNVKFWGRWRIKNRVMEGSKDSLVWELQAWEMRRVENQTEEFSQPLRKAL